MNMKKLCKLASSAIAGVSVLSASAINAFAEEGTAATAQTQGSGSAMLISLIVIFVLMYFLMIRPQKKKEKETKAMQDSIQIGDEIVTIGGIVGLVVRKGDDNIVIETGGEKNKMRIKLWAVSENTTALERAKEKKQANGMAAAKLKEEKDAEKEEKKSKKKKDSDEE